MPRFVILRHDPPPLGTFRRHWDLMLEYGEILKTWALAEEPRVATEIPANQLADHRAAYLQYEGPVSRGRGEVARWDGGTYETIASNEQEWKLRIRGERLCGTASIRRQETTQRWTVEFSDDDTTSS